ncbi:phosphatase PAP2 family protein [Actinacidiphila acididurans]|uniref:Phosphatase PAP2 family protein n=1 Tax=Actinacidiphila acididurans TaxID=2784346 RepID=A0ABS2TZP4_9ACTN|nr:phosphatase PAP2 family protein [Actinacidiphila acididurans]MBM9508426.1 phosphatase PAP2 family protein [Actinacidiphila acididurans]
MAQVADDSVNPDISLLRGINGLARQAPRGVDRAVQFIGDYGLLAVLAVLTFWCWWRVARRAAEAPAAVAGVAWAVLAAGLSLLLGLPIRALVARPRPYEEHDGLDVLVRTAHDYSFVSGRAAFAGAVAVGLFMVSRRAGLIAGVLALAEGFTQVYTGAHYPTDVVGGFALGAATALLLAPIALALLTAAATATARSRWKLLVRAPGAATRPAPRPGQAATPRHSAADKDLAA